MPRGETIADYLRGAREEKRTARNDAWGRVRDVANLGMDVWKTVSEQNKYKPGSNYYEFQRKSLVDWPTDAARQRAEIELKQSKDFLDYQRNNPMKPADQLFQEWLMTPAGQASLNDQWKRDQDRIGLEHRNRMDEIRAANGGKSLSADAQSIYDKAIQMAREKYLEVGADGSLNWKKGVTPEMVLAELMVWADPKLVGADNVDVIKRLFQQFVNDPWMDTTKNQTNLNQSSLELQKILETIAGLVPKASPAPPPTPNLAEKVSQEAGPAIGGIAAGPMGGIGSDMLNKSRREQQLEATLASILKIANISKEDKDAAAFALKESSKVGLLDDQKYATYAAVARSLQQKYGGGIRATK